MTEALEKMQYKRYCKKCGNVYYLKDEHEWIMIRYCADCSIYGLKPVDKPAEKQSKQVKQYHPQNKQRDQNDQNEIYRKRLQKLGRIPRTPNCKGRCGKFQARLKPGVKIDRKNNVKRCRTCSVYIKTTETRCPCCNRILATRPRGRRKEHIEREERLGIIKRVRE